MQWTRALTAIHFILPANFSTSCIDRWQTQWHVLYAVFWTQSRHFFHQHDRQHLSPTPKLNFYFLFMRNFWTKTTKKKETQEINWIEYIWQGRSRKNPFALGFAVVGTQQYCSAICENIWSIWARRKNWQRKSEFDFNRKWKVEKNSVEFAHTHTVPKPAAFLFLLSAFDIFHCVFFFRADSFFSI